MNKWLAGSENKIITTCWYISDRFPECIFINIGVFDSLLYCCNINKPNISGIHNVNSL